MRSLSKTVITTVALGVLALVATGCEPPEGNLKFGDSITTDAQTETSKDDGTNGDSCADDNDCSAGNYCAKNACGDAAGTCTAQPEGCFAVYIPVCGCDGKTYGNACNAAEAGANVASVGECGVTCAELQCPPNSVGVDTDGDGCLDTCKEVGPGFCQSNADCAATEFCNGPCGQPGTCEAKPNGCFDLWAPVCGCDGTTHSNSCDANAVGVAVDYDGECKVDCPTIACPVGQVAVDTTGDGCAESCIPQSDACIPDVQFSDAPGAPVPAPSCGPNEFCQATAGTCGSGGGLGVCVPQNQGCPELYAPVCGCDGNTYGSACDAINAGAQKLHDGACITCDLIIDCGPGYQSVDTNGDGCDDSCEPIGAPCGGADPFACGEDQFCETLEGMCTFGVGTPGTPEPTDPSADAAAPWAPGTCIDIPQVCPDVYAPVCGCDGVTYGNDCERKSAAVSKEHQGVCKDECPPTIPCPPGEVSYDSNGDGCFDACKPIGEGCLSNVDCPGGSYCAKSGCNDGPGACETTPEACIGLWAPVCGCDGVTYGNSCEAAAAGVNVAGPGECGGGPMCGGFGGLPCEAGSFCELPVGMCGASDFGGACVAIPGVCTDEYAPVCGCDGNTYSNDCERQASQAQAAHPGECGNCNVVVDCLPGYEPTDTDGDGCNDSCVPVANACGGFSGLACPPNMVCDNYEGQCGWSDVPGTCVPAPTNCDATELDPVCGCDGHTYDNDCARLGAGVSKDYSGECVDCPTIACPDGTSPVDTDGDGCGDSCLAICPPVTCPDGYKAIDIDGDGCADECVVAGCSGDVTCPNGSVAIDSDGDGCKDQCLQGAPCGGANGTFSCGPEQFCELDAGACTPFQGDGVCISPPAGACPLAFAPVCGCDGVTYDNDCLRQSASVAKWANGSCDDGTDPGTP